MSRGGFSPQEALCLGPRYPDTLLHLGCPEILSPQVCLGSRPPTWVCLGRLTLAHPPPPICLGNLTPHLSVWGACPPESFWGALAQACRT